MTGDDDLLVPLSRAVAPSPAEPEPARVEEVRRLASDHVRRPVTEPVTGPANKPPTEPEDGRRRPRASGTGDRHRRPLAALATAAAAAVLVAGGAVLGDRLGGARAERGEAEFEAALTGDAGSATVHGELVGTGRIVRFDSDDLPVLPKGEFYEVWFLAPDAGGEPGRISAGTFHPDQQGRSHVNLFAAVDPTVYTGIEVTAEPGDGDPDPAEDPVLTGPLSLR